MRYPQIVEKTSNVPRNSQICGSSATYRSTVPLFKSSNQMFYATQSILRPLSRTYRSQKKSSIHAAGTKRDVEAQSRCIIAPQRPLCSRLSHEFCARLRTARGFHQFYAGFARGIIFFKAGLVHGKFASSLQLFIEKPETRVYFRMLNCRPAPGTTA